MDNRELCERYPFLLPRDWEGEVPEDYDYSYTWLDEMPTGWRIAFGEQMCADIMKALEKDPHADEYRILQIKEKFGELRWYDSHCTPEINKIIKHYTELSQKICINCGKPAVWNSIGWVSPYCDDCARKNRWYPKVFEPIEKEEK